MSSLPTKAEVWKKKGTRDVMDWDVVDQWLLRIKEAGMLTVLVQRWEVSKATLVARRAELGAPPLPVGRPPEVDLTEYEKQVISLLEGGMSQTDIASCKGVSRQAVGSVVTRVLRKQALAARRCDACGGAGVVACGSNGEPRCKGIGSHHHVCAECGGASSYNANSSQTTEEQMKEHADQARSFIETERKYRGYPDHGYERVIRPMPAAWAKGGGKL